MTQEENFSIFRRANAPSVDEPVPSGSQSTAASQSDDHYTEEVQKVDSTSPEGQSSTDLDHQTDQRTTEEHLTEEQIAELIAKAEQLKIQGNNLYSEQKFEGAITQYEHALGVGR